MKKFPLVVFFIFIILAILILLYNNFALVKYISSASQALFSVPKGLMYGFKVGGDDKATDSKLKKENEALLKKMIDFEKTKRDNEALRSQFETAETHKYSLVPVKIIGFEGTLFSPSSLIISAGSSDRIKKGMGVIVQNNLIGKVNKVSKNYSEVVLSINEKFKTLAKTSDNGVPGVGRGGGDFVVFDRVLASDDISKSKTLLTQGDVNKDGVGIPPDLVIGKITSVNRSPSLPFQTAKVEPQVNFARLETIFVVKGF